MSDTTAMLACPFCGGPAKAWDRNPAIVGCVTPGCSIVTRDPGYNLPDKTGAQISAERWNRRAALAGQADAVQDVAAARRERDEAREAQEYAELQLAYLANELVFNGNSIGWIASKADNYKAALGRAWAALLAAGGNCDGKTELADAIRQHAEATPPAAVPVDALRELEMKYRIRADKWARQQNPFAEGSFEQSRDASDDIFALIAPASIGAEAQEGSVTASAYVGFCPYCGEHECEDTCPGPSEDDQP